MWYVKHLMLAGIETFPPTAHVTLDTLTLFQALKALCSICRNPFR